MHSDDIGYSTHKAAEPPQSGTAPRKFMLKRESLGFLRLQRFIQDLSDRLLEATLGLADIVRGDAGPAMRHQSVQPAGTEGIMQLGIDEGLDCPTKRFGVIAYHGYSPAPVWRYVRLR
jgi:hypothetical protein